MIRAPLLRTFLMVVGSLAFVVVGAAIALAAVSGFSDVLRDGGVVAVGFSLISVTLYGSVGVVAVVFFGYAFVFLSGRLVSRVFGRGVLLEFCPDGFVDRASAVGVGFVSWGEVRRFWFRGVGGQSFMVVKVRDPEAMLGRLNPVKRAIVRLNRWRFTGGEVSIPVSHTGLTEEEMAEEIEIRRKRFQTRNERS